MYKKYFKCKFLSDVVLNADTHTEGNQQSLDYIPGSNFLGIVAKSYKEFKDKNIAYDIFHSGKVRFGDAHISNENKRSLKQPASWFFKKGDEDKKEIFLHHYINDDMMQKNRKDGVQLKQIRTGYFTNDNKILEPEHNFAIKSAYDIKERRSKEGQMYGYDALRKGSEWIFTVEADDEKLLNEVAEKLDGEKNIGRSKTAQFGRVIIEVDDKLNDSINQINPNFMGNDLLIYFESCCAFIDDNGNPTFQPEIDKLGIEADHKEVGIVWEKSQILTKTFSPWNATRKTRDADRVCIDKGSVIYVEGGKVDEEKIKKGIGVYRNEGFGKVIINPLFLKGDKKTALYENPPKKTDNKKNIVFTSIVDKDKKNDDKYIEWINDQIKIQDRYSEVVKATNVFIEKNYDDYKRSISPSQWGAVRERAQRETDLKKLKLDLFRPEESHKDSRGIKVIDDRGGFLRHGKSAQKWREKYKILEKAVNSVDKGIARRFLINLCSEMAKREK